MKTLTHLCRIFLAGSFAVAFVANAHAADVTTTDQLFVKNAYQSGLANARLGELAEGKSANADVKAFATRLIADEGKANAELRTLAETKGLSLVNSPSTVALANTRILEAKAGADFDKTFAAHMVNDRKRTVEIYDRAGTKTQDTDIRAFITKTLPTLKGHLAAAQTLQDKVGR